MSSINRRRADGIGTQPDQVAAAIRRLDAGDTVPFIAGRIAAIPPHRALALLRGRNESVLHLKLETPDASQDHQQPTLAERARRA
jgi:transcriptional accessory protein Tex/SPT6